MTLRVECPKMVQRHRGARRGRRARTSVGAAAMRAILAAGVASATMTRLAAAASLVARSALTAVSGVAARSSATTTTLGVHRRHRRRRSLQPRCTTLALYFFIYLFPGARPSRSLLLRRHPHSSPRALILFLYFFHCLIICLFLYFRWTTRCCSGCRLLRAPPRPRVMRVPTRYVAHRTRYVAHRTRYVAARLQARRARRARR